MRDQSTIENRLRGLLCQELDRRLEEAVRRVPSACRHNYRHPLDHRKTVDGVPNPDYNRISKGSLPVVQTLGLCMLGAVNGEWTGTICEDPVDAQRCPQFDRLKSTEEVYEQFLQDLETRTLSGEVLALFWVLSSEGTVKLPWWKRLMLRFFLRVDYEPMQAPIRDIALSVLPSVEELNAESKFP